MGNRKTQLAKIAQDALAIEQEEAQRAGREFEKLARYVDKQGE